MKTKERYKAVNGAWPVAKNRLPPLSPRMARTAFRALYRHRFHKRYVGKVMVVRGANKRTWPRWINPEGARPKFGMVLAPDQGWHDFRP